MIDLITAIIAGVTTALMLLAGAFAAGSSRTERKIMERKLRDLEKAREVKDDVDMANDADLADRAGRWVHKPND